MDTKPKWDVFRSIPRADRIFVTRRNGWVIYALQNIKVYLKKINALILIPYFKFLIFILAHFASLLCVLYSKMVVLLLATNTDPTFILLPLYQACDTTGIVFVDHTYLDLGTAIEQSIELRAIFAASLWFIQFFPDLCALGQCVWRISAGKNRGGSRIYKSVRIYMNKGIYPLTFLDYFLRNMSGNGTLHSSSHRFSFIGFTTLYSSKLLGTLLSISVEDSLEDLIVAGFNINVEVSVQDVAIGNSNESRVFDSANRHIPMVNPKDSVALSDCSASWIGSIQPRFMGKLGRRDTIRRRISRTI